MPEENRVSEWNEANLKMKRLHDAQERINYYKRDPQGVTDGKLNFEWWINDINVLYGEGQAKYSDTETKKVDRLRSLILKRMLLAPPHRRVYVDGMGGSKNGIVIDPNEYQLIIYLIEEYESLVKTFNDEHGLSTKNRGTAGLF